MNELDQYLESLRLGRDILDVMLGGRSAMDSRMGTPVTSLEEAQEFLRCYGYDLEDPIDSAELLGIYQESLSFMKRFFLKPETNGGLELEIPKDFFELSDLRKLFVYSSDRSLEHGTRRQWACAIIRLMHTVVHLEKDIRTEYFAAIQQSVFDRFYKEIHNVDDKIFLGDPKAANPISIMQFQTKPRKARDSQILKLLHKPENVAEDIFDQVGVRFVTKSRMDALRVLKFLRDRYIVIPGNLKPSRSKNSLVDVFLYRRVWREARFEARKQILGSPAEVDAFIERELKLRSNDMDISEGKNNPFTSNTYSSIQFTCRQLVKIQSPIYNDVKNLKNKLRTLEDPEVKKFAERVDLTKLSREQRFFYPFEVQIMDAHSYEDSLSGDASHSSYKAAQIEVAMRRVLGSIIKEK